MEGSMFGASAIESEDNNVMTEGSTNENKIESSNAEDMIVDQMSLENTHQDESITVQKEPENVPVLEDTSTDALVDSTVTRTSNEPEVALDLLVDTDEQTPNKVLMKPSELKTFTDSENSILEMSGNLVDSQLTGKVNNLNSSSTYTDHDRDRSRTEIFKKSAEVEQIFNKNENDLDDKLVDSEVSRIVCKNEKYKDFSKTEMTSKENTISSNSPVEDDATDELRNTENTPFENLPSDYLLEKKDTKRNAISNVECLPSSIEATMSPCFPLIRDKEKLLPVIEAKEDVDDIPKSVNTNKIEEEKLLADSVEKVMQPSENSHVIEECSDGINIVSSSLDNRNIFDAIPSSCNGQILESTLCETTSSEKVSGYISGENSADVSTEVSGDTSAELSGDISYISSIDDEDEAEPLPYNQITENVYLVDKKKSRMHKEVRRMKCDCSYEPDEPDFVGCGASCMNRVLMIECGSKCLCGEFCTNKNFQRGCKYDLEVFKAGKKGWGLKTKQKIEAGVFIIEYCGEVVNYSEFMKRTETYDHEGRKHYYFMTLKANEIIDATRSGNISRFINHSCDPNCVTQKWTVNGFLRVGFFSLREIKEGEELSFDYQYQRYGEKAQRCLCGSVNCRGVIGELKQVPLKTPEKISSNSDSPRRKTRKKSTNDYTVGFPFGEEIAAILGDEQRICTATEALNLTRLMVKTAGLKDRWNFVRILRDLVDFKGLKAFVRYNGLSLLWSWMVDAPCKEKSFKVEVLNVLKTLPIPNKSFLEESKLLPLMRKLSNYQDTQDICSSRSDEEGSSNSDNEITGNDVKDDLTLCEKQGSDAFKTRKDDDGESPEDSDNSEKNEEIAGLASELLDQWKVLREVFIIPKKTPVLLEPSKQVVDSTASPIEERRNGKRKIEKDNAANLFSPKRQFSPHTSLKGNSPMLSQVLESPTQNFVSESSSTSSASPIRSNNEVGSNTPSKTDEDATINKNKPNQSKQEDDLAKKLHGTTNTDLNDSRNQSKDWYGNTSKRNYRTQQDVFQTNYGYNARGHRGNRGQGRGRSRGHSGFQYGIQHNPASKPVYDMPNFPNIPAKDYQHFPVSGTGRPNDFSRMPTTNYSYQAIRQGIIQSNPNDFQSRTNVHAERQQNIDPRSNDLRNAAFNAGHFGKQRPEWQRSAVGAQSPYSPARIPSSIATPPPIPPVAPPPQHFGPPPLMNQPGPNMPVNQHWNVNSPGSSFGGLNVRHQDLGLQSVVSQPPPMGITNQLPTQAPAYSYRQERLRNETVDPVHQQPPPPQNVYLQQQQSSLVQQLHQSTSLPTSHPNSNPSVPSVIMKHLHDMVQQSKLVTAQESQQPHQTESAYRTPERPDGQFTTPTSRDDQHLSPMNESPVSSKPIAPLPPNWKTATDPEGKIYYYHVVTRKTQWEVPKWETDESQHEKASYSERKDKPGSQKKLSMSHSGPRTPPASPPHSPISPARYSSRPPAISDPAVSTTKLNTVSIGHSEHLTPKQQKVRDQFKMKLSAVVVNCLNPYQKVDCKHARIAKIEDFKFLARKLTHGLMMKELSRVKHDEDLECSDSVKIKVKEYIRNYMKRFGEIYIRS